MKTNSLLITMAGVLAGAGLLLPGQVFGHCDTMDGPVVLTARTALEKQDVTPVLKWVKKDSEAEIKSAFAKTLAVRSQGPEARELADRFFFETLVRVHRAEEGAPFTGLKPAGIELAPAIEEADKALESGSVEKVIKLVTDEVTAGIHRRFAETREKKAHAEHNVAMGREFVAAYVEYVHYVEGVHQAAQGSGTRHETGHEATPAQEAPQESAPQHKH